MSLSKLTGAFGLTVLMTSAANADDVLSVLTASAGYEGGVSVTTHQMPDEQSCQLLAYSAAAAVHNGRGGRASVMCLQTDGVITGQVCQSGREPLPVCTKLEF